jgi:hypothetical protein
VDRHGRVPRGLPHTREHPGRRERQLHPLAGISPSA